MMAGSQKSEVRRQKTWGGAGASLSSDLCLLDSWVAAGRRDPDAAEVLFHAHVCAGHKTARCPFGDEAPRARERWWWYLRLAAGHLAETGAGTGGPSPAHPREDLFWWRRGSMA